MEYKLIRINEESNTATVLMSIGNRTLQQDFDLGESADDLQKNIHEGFSVFRRDIDNGSHTSPVAAVYRELLDVVRIVRPVELTRPKDDEIAKKIA